MIRKTPGIRIGGIQIGKPSPVGTYADWYGRVDFDRDAFTAALADKGYDVIWERALFCPNRVPATSHGGIAPKEHRVDCQICDGSGYIYYAPTSTRMLMTSMGLSQGFYAYGRWDSGSQMVTTLPEIRIHPFDRLTLQNGVARYQEIVRRQPDTNIDTLKYAPLCVDNISWVNRVGTMTTYSEVSYTVVNNTIVWSSISRPDNNDYYVISYSYRPRYIVMELMHQHRESTVDGVHYEFPVQAMAKLEFLIRDEGRDAAETEDTSPFPE